MKERPILLNGEMVRAILDGRKTQTRRVVKPQPAAELNPASIMWNPFNKVIQSHHDGTVVHCPYGQPGDRLWVRERWRTVKSLDACKPSQLRSGAPVGYWDCKTNVPRFEDGPLQDVGKWRPSIFMPRWASRITLEIADVRVERLTDISEEDAMAEGVEQVRRQPSIRGQARGRMWKDYSGLGVGFYQARQSYWSLWDAICGTDLIINLLNPWVWAITFKRSKEVEG